jgi:uncharacterized protein YjbI with pentapeptide repeats
MTNLEHVTILKRGTVADWNVWRREHRDVRPDFSGTDLHGADLHNADLIEANLSEARLGDANLSGAMLNRASLSGADLRGANLASAGLQGADLKKARLGMGSRDDEAFAWLRRIMAAHNDSANLVHADLSNADLRGAVLEGVHLNYANLSGANLEGTDLSGTDMTGATLIGAQLMSADLVGANLTLANLTNADLSKANLKQATLVKTKVNGAAFSECHVYGVSAWGLDLTAVKNQSGLIITPDEEAKVTVDNLEVAQFLYLMLHNEKIRDVIETITGRGVLILGRFTDERKAVLDAVKIRLRDFNLVPIVFDWKKPTKRDLTETVQLLASMSRFVVADVTDARSIPQELSHIVPFLPSVPIRPIILAGHHEYAMFEHWTRFRTVLPVFEYRDQAHLVGNIEQQLIAPVEEWEASYDKTKALEKASREKDEALLVKDRQLAALRAEIEKLKKQV